ncbi:G elongation factor, mitochondrial 2 [Perkinsus olseni]|uniref:G elongation factor, mitochondrial 2 n=1 Tax=Perkinsus olseni TaxID=32597 RepID=A0A7J6S7D3_PEROL|nr:G elongation factor, mitochondrial 2 [Perkinsus olseni]
MTSLNTRLPPSKAKPLAIQYPLWRPRGALRSVVDLLTTKAYSFEGKHGTSVVEDTIGDHEMAEVMEARNELLETLAILDEDFGTAYLDRSEEDPAVVADAVRRQCLQRTISPVCFGSALGNQGIQHLLDAVALYLPNPIDAHTARPEYVPDPKDGGVLMEAFKVLPPMGKEEKDKGNIVYCRILSGSLKARAAVTNQTRKSGVKGKTVESVRELFYPKASEIEPCKELRGGEVGVVTGLNNVRSGDILTSGSSEQLRKLSTVMANRMKDAAAHAPSCVCFAPFTTPTLQQDQELAKALDRMMLEDPSIEFRKDKSEQILVWGMGDLHLELCRDRIRDEFNIPVEMGKLHVTYREHVNGEVRMSFHDESGGTGVHLDVSLGPARALPNVYGGEMAAEGAYANEVVFSKEIDGGSMKVHNAFREKIEQWLHESFQSGPRLYAEFAASRVTIHRLEANNPTGLRMHLTKLFSELARKALNDGYITVLEPVVSLTISGPPSVRGTLSGPVYAEIVRHRRGFVASSDLKDEYTFEMQAFLPQSHMSGYASQIRRMTSGQADIHVLPAGLAEAQEDTLPVYQTTLHSLLEEDHDGHVASTVALSLTCPPPLMSCKRHGTTTEAPPLPVVIIESHTEGLPAIHMAIRRGWIRDSRLEVFHVDAHPDLAASKAIEPGDIFGDQLDLYTKLENDAYGISTWLLPPILQGHIGKVVWCRPTWAHQLPDGHHAGLRLGFRDGRMRVWTTLPYWAAEDEAVDPSSGTGPEDPSTSFDLLVSTAVGLQPEAADTTTPCWILDIDLDYFSCSNPVL